MDWRRAAGRVIAYSFMAALAGKRAELCRTQCQRFCRTHERESGGGNCGGAQRSRRKDYPPLCLVQGGGGGGQSPAGGGFIGFGGRFRHGVAFVESLRYRADSPRSRQINPHHCSANRFADGNGLWRAGLVFGFERSDGRTVHCIDRRCAGRRRLLRQLCYRQGGAAIFCPRRVLG